MNIVVLLKQVHDPSMPRTWLRIAPSARTIQLPAGANPILNGYDANALEEALRLREKRGGMVTALTVGPESAKDVLRRAIAMGADKAVHIAGPAGIDGDSSSTATLLAAAIRTLGAFDLVLAGRSASDTDAGVVPMLLAAQLAIAAFTPVRTLSTDEHGVLLADRITESGFRRIRVRGPAVICVSNEINEPRRPQLKGIAAAKRAVIPTLAAEQLVVERLECALELHRLFIPEQKKNVAEMISTESAAEAGCALADRLHAEGLV